MCRGPSTGAEQMEQTLAMIQGKSERLLPPPHHRALMRGVGDYAGGRVPMTAILAVASRILDTPLKVGAI